MSASRRCEALVSYYPLRYLSGGASSHYAISNFFTALSGRFRINKGFPSARRVSNRKEPLTPSFFPAQLSIHAAMNDFIIPISRCYRLANKKILSMRTFFWKIYRLYYLTILRFGSFQHLLEFIVVDELFELLKEFSTN